MPRNDVSRRAVLTGGIGVAVGSQIPAIFGGRIAEEGAHPYARLFEAGFQPLPGGGVPFGRCGATHVGGGLHVSAAHCGIEKGITLFRLDGRPVQQIEGRYWIFGPDSYDPAGLIDDFLFLHDPASAALPSVPLATPEMYVDLRQRVGSGETVRALAVGYGTTRLDSRGRPTDVSGSLREIDVVIRSATTREIAVADPTGAGGVCVGDSGSALLWQGHLLGPTSSVPLNPATGFYCDIPGWAATYKSLELQLDRLAALRAAIAKFGRA